ncbi:sterol desaturase family protein [Pseudonocardia alni]|uniref:sterol desaturase family protein n=1 Tax=Pseudonocardia alni TaxID=33907 RepID=UPI0027A2337E|nr:sterol desaturase family protein [Pseudonocardia alni]
MEILTSLTNIPQIMVTWTTYVVAGIVFVGIGLWLNRANFSVREFAAGRFPFNLRSSRSARLDVKVYVLGKLTDAVWGAPGTALSALLPVLVALGLAQLVPAAPSGPASILTITAIGIALFVAVEFADFVMHYGEHKIPALWELHKVHHSADSLNPLTSKRGHPVSLVLVGLVRAVFFCVPAGLAIHFAGLSLFEIVAARALVLKTCSILTLDPLRHSPFPVTFGWLDRLFISPHMHQIHHSSLRPHWDRNFGTNLSLFDWLFRTGYKPVRNEPIALGLYGYTPEDAAHFHTLRGTYLTPLVSASRKILPGHAGSRRSADRAVPAGAGPTSG